MSRLRRQMSYRASLSTWLVTSVCSRSECTQSTVLYGSTHEVGLELGDVHVERTVEAERRGERGDHLADIPVDEGALGVHEIELVIDARHHL